MNQQELHHFICIRCQMGSLHLALKPGETQEGMLKCAHCAAEYPLRGGIPRFVDNEQYSQSFGFQWNIFRQTQFDSYTGKPLSADRLFSVSQWPKNLANEKILEAGSGAGRFTEVLLKTGAMVFSFDLSSAVEANYASNGAANNLNLFQASIYEIPLPKQYFDKVICLGVLQHTPDPDRAFAALAGFVKPGGALVVDVYARRLRGWLAWKYVLRPITKRLPQRILFASIKFLVNALLPLTMLLRRIGGKAGARLMPILDYSHLGLPKEVNRQWAILDTFDMYAPAHDHPRSIAEVKRWFEIENFVDVTVEYGPNGVIGRGRRPKI